MPADSRSTALKLSMLWIFVMLNFFARDLHELARPGVLEQMMSGTFDGVKITEELMLLGGIMFEVPMLMVILSLLLDRPLNRWVHAFAVLFTAGTILMNNTNPDLDNLFFMVVQLAALSSI
ncbi:MAG TPA: hypothetical protein DD437_14210, partial [Rhodobiaceae bacterium]|nr:hypothetical protein [Rhodobiaceae bacterium]